MKKFLSIMTLALLSASFAGCAGGSQSTLIPQAQSQGARADQIGNTNDPPPTIATVHSGCHSCVGVPTTGGSDGVGTSAQNPGGCAMAISHREKGICRGGGSDGGVDVAQGADCTGALATNTTAVLGSGNHNDMISANTSMISISQYGVQQPVAFEYQTFGGQEYVQFFVTVSAGVNAGPFAIGVASTHSPIIPFNGNLYAAINLAAKATNMTGNALPFPLNQIKPNTSAARTSCNKKTITTG